jgi:hypothetical protein
MVIGGVGSLGAFGYAIISQHWWDGSTPHVIEATLWIAGYVLFAIGLASTTRFKRSRGPN